ncbi:MAG: hypothetical protein AAGG01_06400 [Planctomycetota bacterium]
MVAPLTSSLLAAAAALSGSDPVVEPGGAVVQLVDGRAVRVRGVETIELRCTEEEGTGIVRDLAADPAGLTFLAAERGLFVLGPRVDHLDPIWRRQGAPEGRPTSVHVDERRRVWLATEDAVGVLEPSFGWGRTLGSDDGLHLAPPFRVVPAGDELRIEGSNGAWTYRPDEGPRPLVTSVEVNDAGIGADELVEASYGTSLKLAASGSAAGGATFRFRVDGHHVWRDVATEGTLTSLNPGEHRIEVVAGVRDLYLSEPFPLRVRVAMPFYFGNAFILGAMTLAGGLIFALFLLLQRPGTPPWRRAVSGVLSTAVAIVFGLQILAGLIPHAKGWPFVGYSMYSKSFRPEHPVHRPLLIARHKDGEEREIPPWALGYAIDGRWQVLGPIVTGGPDVERDALERVRKRVTGPDYAVLQVQSRRFRLTRNGPVPIAPLVLSHHEYAGAAGGGQ